jgi:hypothetical protein
LEDLIEASNVLREELDKDLLAFFGLEDPSRLVLLHFRQLAIVSSFDDLLMFFGCPNREQCDLLSLTSIGRSLHYLVYNGCRQGLLVWIRPEGFRYLLLGILTEEFEVVVNELVYHESLSIE